MSASKLDHQPEHVLAVQYSKLYFLAGDGTQGIHAEVFNVIKEARASLNRPEWLNHHRQV